VKIKIGRNIVDGMKCIDEVSALYAHTPTYHDAEFVRRIVADPIDDSIKRQFTDILLMNDLDAYVKSWGSDTVTVTEDDRYKGVGVFGATGAGKSVLLSNMINQELLQSAVILIDPSGKLALDVYSLAKMYKKPITYLSRENPCIGLNIMLAPYSREQVAELVISYVNHITLTTSSDLVATTRMRNAIYDVVVWCLEHKRPRLDALMEKLKLKRDPKNQFAIDGVVSRLENILSDQAVCDILCSENSVNFLDIAKNNEALVVDTFGMGELPQVAVGSALTFLLKDTFLSVRRDVYDPLSLYIDECHLFIDKNYFHLLKMARKFGIKTTLATQDFVSLVQGFKDVMLANLGTIIAIKPGRKDARDIADEFKTLTDQDVKFTEKYHAAVKTPDFEGVVELERPPFVVPINRPERRVIEMPMWFPI
jgi:hypothetical protein